MRAGVSRELLQDFVVRELAQLERANLLWRERMLQTPSVPHARVDGKDVLMLCSNNYLGLCNHPALKRAAIEAVRKYGVGSGSVRVIAGTMEIHVRLEKKLAEFKDTEDSIVFQSGFAANAGSITALVGEGDLIISDELNHGSIIDGCRLTKAERKVYPHKDTEGLKALLEDSGNYHRVLVITDGVFSMDGDIAPLPEIAKLAKKYGAMTYVDDAHGDGVLGEGGKGIVNHFHLEGKVDIEMGTFSKAFGCVGGYIVGGERLCEFLLNKVRSYLLSGSHPPAVAAACLAALEVVEENPGLVKTLWENTRYFKSQLKSRGFDIGQSETPITPVMVGKSELAHRLAEELFKQGVFVLPIVYPMVAKDKARIRTIVTAAHSKEDLDFAVEKFDRTGQKLKLV